MPRKGYTLFELMLVLAMLVVLAAVAIPSMDSMSGTFRVTEAADMVRAKWALARSHAMNECRPYRFAVVPSRGNFRLAPDSSEFWAGGNPSGGSGSSGGDQPALVQEDSLPKGVRFSEGGNPAEGGWQKVAVFLPDGRAENDVEITFTCQGALPVVLRLRALTGAVTVRTINPYKRR